MSFTSPEFRQPPDTGHRRGHRAAVIAIVVVVLALIAVVVVVATRGVGRNAAPGGGPVPAPDAAPSTSTVTSRPITWLQVGPVQLPFSDTAGPRVQEGVLARGFAHTADGALIAALQIPFRVYSLSGTEQIIADQVLGDDSDRDEVRAQASRLQASLDTNQVLPRAFAWRAYEPYDDQAATYDIATPTADGQYNVFRLTVVWISGDWKYQPNYYESPADPIPAATITGDPAWHQFTDRSLR
ncbi:MULTISPECIES: hypothetical protein [Gordonia]|uniref:hypothetical protein n=1 Tax=Gordonia TaxID=2053 RepID=UPI0007EC1FA0|nr:MULTISPECIES: hypothetical protein [Gordonia]OBC06989.1 hypothetical protein A5785_09030 [Gordonia sp. 852002-50395_SCH5434458]OBC17861.1 hypothetical protein A5786_17890 [Gordonia sp. 852002-50816_SCH5313054-a]OBC18259.1 hypothetical protein A5788_10655 [Gordonia sp. 852002-50816_SCH5313054-c]SKX69926.1 Uncharacterised protein [Mycobacteroides abscessus subsp. abscessus]